MMTAALVDGSATTYCQVEVCAVIYDDGVIPAEFEQRPTQPLPDDRGHVAPDRYGPRKGDQRQPRIPNHGFRKRRLISDEQRKDSGIPLLLHDLVANLLRGNRAQRRLGRGFPDDRITGDGGEECIPCPHRDRKIKRRDDPDGTERMPLLAHAMRRSLGLHGRAIQHA